MFGNHLLPNIAPSLLLFLPPPPDASPLPLPPLSPLQPPTWAKQGHAHCQCQCPPTMPCHHCIPLPCHLLFNGPCIHHTATTAPPLVKGCGWVTSGTSSTANGKLSVPPSNATLRGVMWVWLKKAQTQNTHTSRERLNDRATQSTQISISRY